MQLDRTQIAIRERTMLDILDLSLHLLRAYTGPLIVTFLLAMVPLLGLNYLLIGWMSNVVYDEQFPYRFMWNMLLLVFLESQIVSVFSTYYLGQAVFTERPRIFWQTINGVFRMTAQIVCCQLLLRAIVPAWLIYLLLQRGGEFEPGVEIFCMLAIVGYSIILRGVRPFINEIVVLERNPLRRRGMGQMTVARRSSLLHGPSAGELFMRSMGSYCLGVLLWMGLYGLFLFCSGIILDDWRQGWFMVTWCYPLSLWMVAFFFTVARFLSYLDLRIRQEGWEVELKLRAEATRLTEGLV